MFNKAGGEIVSELIIITNFFVFFLNYKWKHKTCFNLTLNFKLN